MILLVFGMMACGAGSGASEPTADIATDTDKDSNSGCNVEPTIASLEDNYFSMSCTFSSCHSDTAAQGDLVLTSGNAYDNLVNVAAANKAAPGEIRVIPGDPDGSYLVHRVELTGNTGAMPPNITEPLGPDCQIKALREWIAAGAPKE